MARLRLRTILITSFSNNYEYQRQISKRPCMVLCGYYSYFSFLLLNNQRRRDWKILSTLSHWFYNKPGHIHLHTQKEILSSRGSTERRGQERVTQRDLIPLCYLLQIDLSMESSTVSSIESSRPGNRSVAMRVSSSFTVHQ